MLVLSLKNDQSALLIDEHGTTHSRVVVTAIRGDKVRLGFDAAPCVSVLRTEIAEPLHIDLVTNNSPNNNPGLHNLIGQFVRGTVNGTGSVVKEGVAVSILGREDMFQRVLIKSVEHDYYVLNPAPLEVVSQIPPYALELVKRVNSRIH